MSAVLNIKKNFFFYTCVVLACFPILPMKLTVYAISLWLVAAIVEYFNRKEFPSRQNLKWLIPLGSFYVFYLIHALLVGYNEDSFHTLERKFSLLIIPLGFFLIRRPISKKEFHWILRAFQWSTFFLCIYIVLRIIQDYPFPLSGIKNISFSYYFRTIVEEISGIHPTYLSILLLFSVFLTINKLIGKSFRFSILELTVSFLQILLLSAICLLLAAKGPIIFFIISLAITFFFRSFKNALIFLIGSIIITCIAIWTVPSISQRFKELISDQKDNTEEIINSTDIRKGIYNCSRQLLKEHWLLGAGISNTQLELNECYQQYEDPVFLKSSFNTHNQYTDILIGTGVIGLLLLVMMVFYPFHHILNKKYMILIFFKFFMILCFMTENVLSRQYGVIFFSFFNVLFVHFYINTLDLSKSKRLN